MTEYIIKGKKGQYKRLFKEFFDYDYVNRITYSIRIDPQTFEQTVTFTPRKGFSEISEEDLAELKKLIDKCN